MATSTTAADRSDKHLDERITYFKDWIFEKSYYRIPLGFLVDLGLVNLAENTDTKFVFTLERNMNELFEYNKKVASIPDKLDALIQFHDTSYISYQEINLTQNFRIYFNGFLRSKTSLRMGVLPSPYQQNFKMNTGPQSLKVLFKGAQRQLEWIEVSLVFDKSYLHQTTYHSYDVELAGKLIQSIYLKNVSDTYSLMGQLEYNVKNAEDMQWLYKMFVSYNCDGCSTVQLTQYKNNPIHQEITMRDEYGAKNKYDRIYINMKRSKGYTV